MSLTASINTCPTTTTPKSGDAFFWKQAFSGPASDTVGYTLRRILWQWDIFNPTKHMVSWQGINFNGGQQQWQQQKRRTIKLNHCLRPPCPDGSRQQNGGKIWPMLTYLAFLLSALMDITYGKDHKGRLFFCVATKNTFALCHSAIKPNM